MELWGSAAHLIGYHDGMALKLQTRLVERFHIRLGSEALWSRH